MSSVRVEHHGHVAHLVLAAPQRRNALTTAMATELIAACDALDSDDNVGAVVVDGEGPAFCAGADRSLLASVAENPLDTDVIADLRTIYSAFVRIGHLQAPTVAAIRGAAVGAGVNLAAATDLRIIAVDARIIAGFQRIGVHPGGGHFALLARSVGYQVAAALTVFGQELDGRRAAEVGFAWAALPRDQVLARSFEIAGEIAGDPALARSVVRTARAEFGPPVVAWDIALEMELAPQLWSLHRAAKKAADR